MKQLTNGDVENIEAFKDYSTEDLFMTIEALHTIKLDGLEPDLEGNIKTTIEALRSIIDDRGVMH